MTQKTKKGVCTRRKKFYGLIKVTDKGQIAIPVDLRKELDIKAGDSLIVIKRKDEDGLNLIKATAIEGFIEKLSNN